MHVVGARFRTLAAAGAALLAVRSAVKVPPGDAGVRPLGSTRYEEATEDFLLAGRFADEDVEAVAGIMEAAGGRIIERRRDVARTGPTPDRPGGLQGVAASNPPWTASWVPARTFVKPATAQPASGARKVGRAAATAPTARARKRPRRPAALLRFRAARAHRSR